MNNKGEEKGSPCLIPQEDLKGFDGVPLTKIEKNVEDERLITH